MAAILNGEAETPFTAGEVAKGEQDAAGGATEAEVEDEDSAAVDGRSVYVGNVSNACSRPIDPTMMNTDAS